MPLNIVVHAVLVVHYRVYLSAIIVIHQQQLIIIDEVLLSILAGL